MDLSALGSSLPPGLAQTEREMGDKFRASALSITTLYKSALAATKQAYSVGYTSCLSDVLEIVQNSLSESSENGQDAGQALSRLMDWADARKAAMQAFESDEERDEAGPKPQAPIPVPRSHTPLATSAGIPNKAGPSAPRSSLPLHLAQSAPARPSSAPVTPHGHEQVEMRGRSAEPSYNLNQSARPHQSAGPSRLPASSSNLMQTPAPLSRGSRYQPTPAQIPSSSPTSSTPPLPFPHASSHTSPSFSAQHRTTRHLPRHSTGTISSDGVMASNSPFAPALGLEQVPFVSFPSTHTHAPSIDVAFGLGSKRPISAVLPAGDEMTGVEEPMPGLIRSSSVSGQRGGRRKGPRASVVVDESGNNSDERERKRTSRRGGGGAGGGGL